LSRCHDRTGWPSWCPGPYRWRWRDDDSFLIVGSFPIVPQGNPSNEQQDDDNQRRCTNDDGFWLQPSTPESALGDFHTSLGRSQTGLEQVSLAAELTQRGVDLGQPQANLVRLLTLFVELFGEARGGSLVFLLFSALLVCPFLIGCLFRTSSGRGVLVVGYLRLQLSLDLFCFVGQFGQFIPPSLVDRQRAVNVLLRVLKISNGLGSVLLKHRVQPITPSLLRDFNSHGRDVLHVRRRL